MATRVLLPVLSDDEAMVCEVLAPPAMAAPFNVQLTAQEPSLGVTVKTVFVPLAAATRKVFELGLVPTIEQAGKTLTVQVQEVES